MLFAAHGLTVRFPSCAPDVSLPSDLADSHPWQSARKPARRLARERHPGGCHRTGSEQRSRIGHRPGVRPRRV